MIIGEPPHWSALTNSWLVKPSDCLKTSNISAQAGPILNQTKCFKCDCPRCHDPKEFGSNLSALKCKNKSAGCLGIANPIDSLSLDSDLQCEVCQHVIPSDLAKMMQDTAMNSLHEYQDPDTCQANNFNYTTVANLGKAIYIRLAEMKCSLLMVI